MCGTPTRLPPRPSEGPIAKSFQCADAGVICGANVTGATEEEVLAKAIEHAKAAHGVDLAQSTTLARYAHSLIKDEDA